MHFTTRICTCLQSLNSNLSKIISGSISQEIVSGSKEYTVYFGKTFETPPIVVASANSPYPTTACERNVHVCVGEITNSGCTIAVYTASSTTIGLDWVAFG